MNVIYNNFNQNVYNNYGILLLIIIGVLFDIFVKI